MSNKFRVFCLSLLISMSCASPSFSQSGEYMQGVQLFNKRDYRGALSAFNKALKDYPTDGNIHYYMGSCYYAMRDINSCKQSYANAIKYGKTQPPGKAALKALLAIDPAFARASVPPSSGLMLLLPGGGGGGAAVQQIGSSGSTSTTTSTHTPSAQTWTRASSGSSSASEINSLPREARLHFDGEPAANGMVFVAGAVNGRPQRFMFDTGAEVCLFGKNHLKQLGIPVPTGEATGYVAGLGRNMDSWNLNVDLRVGSVERRNFKITVQEVMNTEPLLGQSFFKDFQVSMDKGNREIHLTRNDSVARSSSTSSNYYDVPFTTKGALVIVNAQVNGKNTPMIFDTGASETQFLVSQLQPLNITIPSDAIAGASSGIGGTTRTRKFPIDKIRLGPVEKTQFTITVAESARMEYPLLGQDFFGDWRYSIDNNSKVIKFISRSQ